MGDGSKWAQLQEAGKKFLRLLDFIGRWETRLNALLFLVWAGFIVLLIGVVLFMTLPALAVVVLVFGGYMMTSAWFHLRAIRNRPPARSGPGVDDFAAGTVIKKDEIKPPPQLLSANMTWDTPSGIFAPDHSHYADSDGRVEITFKLRIPKGFRGEVICMVAPPRQEAMYRAQRYAYVSSFETSGEVSIYYPREFPGAPLPSPGLFRVLWWPKGADPLEYRPELKW
ncbi:MAG TPA: hypothetical protein VIG64_11425 [Actinomycetota bacterium]|jgi:hypothetical protein